MQKNIQLLLSLFFCLTQTPAFAQATAPTKPPKIGICLSGGGAKGLAHIGLLRMIDSLGIKVDYISATSMGAVLGGLYAMGYSGDQIKDIALDINWRGILNNKTSLDKINIEEKDEYNRYILETPMSKHFLPTLPTGAVEGQYLFGVLTQLTLPAHCVRNFDDLPIPFHCMAVDAIKGEAVVLKTGNLAQCIRASMAIPLIFTPVRIGDRLFIDGGALQNFPVEEVRSMGADFVIGSYTGFRAYEENELNDAMNFMNRSIAFSQVKEAERQAKLTDILISFNKATAKYTPTSFKDYEEIIEIGEREARKILPQLAIIAASQRNAGIVAQKNVAAIPQNIKIAQLLIETDSAKAELPRIKYRLGIKEGETITITDIQNGLDHLTGTRAYSSVNYRLRSSDIGEDTLIVRAMPSLAGIYKFAVHYDTEQTAGILMNVTLRNWLGKHSRALAILDLADSPRLRLDYYQFLDEQERWSWRANGFIMQRRFNNYNEGKAINNYNNFFWETKIHLQRTLNKNAYIFVNGGYTDNYFVFGSDPETFTQTTALSSWLQRKPSLSFGYKKDSRNQPFFATRGEEINAELNWNISDYNRIRYFVRDSAKAKLREVQNTQYNPQTLRLRFQAAHYFPIHKKASFIVEEFVGIGGAIQDSLPNKIDLGKDNPEGFYLGGTDWHWRDNIVPLLGFRQTEIRANQVMKLGIKLQYSPFKNAYLTPAVEFAAIESGFRDFYKNFFSLDTQGFVAYGITAGYRSPIGPISITYAQNSAYTKSYWYFTLGFK
jgi:NTE family protein